MMLFLVTLISSLSWAQFPPISAKNLSLDMRNNSGVGFVSFLKYQIQNINLTHTALQAQVKKYPDRLIVNDTETQIEFNYTLDFLDNFRAINISEVNLLSQNQEFVFDIQRAEVDLEGDNYVMDKFLFRCNGEEKPKIPKHAFENCTYASLLAMDKITFKENSKPESFFRAVIEEMAPHQKKTLKVKYLHGLALKVKENVLEGEVQIKSLINVTFKLEGTIHYLKELAQFKIELTKAKAGIFDVRKKVFKEISKLNIKEITVNPPYIYIRLRSNPGKDEVKVAKQHPRK